jgi:septation ring formation regulator EzrA
MSAPQHKVASEAPPWIALFEEITRRLDDMSYEIHSIKKKEKHIMATVAEMIELVRAQTTQIQGINVLMDGMRAKIAELIAAQGGIPPELQKQIDDLFAELKAQGAEIQTAVDENTPAAPSA